MKARVLYDDPGGRWKKNQVGAVMELGVDKIDWNGYEVLICFGNIQKEPIVLGDTIIDPSDTYYFRPGEWEVVEE